MDFVFYQPVKIAFGKGMLSKAGELVKQAGYSKAFIVCDAGIKSTGMIDKLTAALDAAGIGHEVFDKVQPNPPIKFVMEGHELCNKSGCDCVIGIGGGSNIDSAKGINCLRFNDPPIERFADPSAKMNYSPGLIIIPTTSGTGSEVSDGLILSDENHNKVPILGGACMSEYAIVDPELVAGLPKKQTIFTGLDALSHCVEAYTTNTANPFNDAMLESNISTIITNLPKVIENGKDIEARSKMAAAATFGGWMLAQAHTHAGHSFGHVVGGLFNIPHGAAVFFGLPYIMEFNAPAVPERTKKIGELFGVKFTGNETVADIGAKTRDAMIFFRDKVAQCPPVKSFSYDESRFAELAKDIEGETFQAFNPRKMTAADALEIIKKVFA